MRKILSILPVMVLFFGFSILPESAYAGWVPKERFTTPQSMQLDIQDEGVRQREPLISPDVIKIREVEKSERPPDIEGRVRPAAPELVPGDRAPSPCKPILDTRSVVGFDVSGDGTKIVYSHSVGILLGVSLYDTETDKKTYLGKGAEPKVTNDGRAVIFSDDTYYEDQHLITLKVWSGNLTSILPVLTFLGHYDISSLGQDILVLYVDVQTGVPKVKNLRSGEIRDIIIQRHSAQYGPHMYTDAGVLFTDDSDINRIALLPEACIYESWRNPEDCNWFELGIYVTEPISQTGGALVANRLVYQGDKPFQGERLSGSGNKFVSQTRHPSRIVVNYLNLGTDTVGTVGLVDRGGMWGYDLSRLNARINSHYIVHVQITRTIDNQPPRIIVTNALNGHTLDLQQFLSLMYQQDRPREASNPFVSNDGRLVYFKGESSSGTFVYRCDLPADVPDSSWTR